MLRTSTPFASAAKLVILWAKPVVDLSAIPPPLIAAANDGHTWDDSSCLPPPTDTYFVGINECLLLRVYHYSGTKEQFFPFCTCISQGWVQLL
jgi:hypothetical protein